MTMIDAALAALETVCSNVSFVKNEEDPLPDSYVVLSVLDDAPEIYAGDLDEQQHLGGASRGALVGCAGRFLLSLGMKARGGSVLSAL